MLERLAELGYMLEQLVGLGHSFLRYELKVRQRLLHVHMERLGFLRGCMVQLLENNLMDLQH